MLMRLTKSTKLGTHKKDNMKKRTIKSLTRPACLWTIVDVVGVGVTFVPPKASISSLRPLAKPFVFAFETAIFFLVFGAGVAASIFQRSQAKKSDYDNKEENHHSPVLVDE